MTDNELTPLQKTFIARAAIVAVVGAYETDDGDALDTIDVWNEELQAGVPDEQLVELGIDQDVIDAYRLAVDDLEKLRVVVEEHAAYAPLMAELAELHPGLTKKELQTEVRRMIKEEPATRERVAEASGVWARMGFEPAGS